MERSRKSEDDQDEENQKPLLLPSKKIQITKETIQMKVVPETGKENNIPIPNEDICSRLMGDWGIWQLRTVLIVYLTKIPAAWFMACIIFTAPFPWHHEYWCDLTEYENNTNLISISHPKLMTANGAYKLDQCSVILESNSSISNKVWMAESNKSDFSTYVEVVPCNTFQFNIDVLTTLATQFDLVCSRNILIAITQSFHLFGVLLGGIAANELMVFFSPKVVMMVGIILMIPFGLATGFIPSFWPHVMFRCLVAATCAIIFTPGATIFSDIVGGSKKVIISANFEQFWSIGVVLLPAIGYFTNKWSEIYITITAPALLFMVLWIWVPDSPRWHLEKGNVEKAKAILENAASVNKLQNKIPENLDELLTNQSQNMRTRNENLKSQNNWEHLFSISGAIWIIAMIFISWSLMFTCYYGTLLNIRSFGRQYLYINTAIAGMCELIGGFFGFMILLYVKHKWKVVGAFTAITGLVNCVIWLMPTHVDGSHMLVDLLIISMFNKIGISACLCVLTTCTAELFPLVHKKRMIYASTVIARIVFITAPLIGATVKFGDAVPLTAFGVLTVIGGLSAFVIKPLRLENINIPTTLNSINGKY